jgi:hypothetical protein
VVEHYLDTVGVAGSNPAPRTILFRKFASQGGAVAEEGLTRTHGQRLQV